LAVIPFVLFSQPLCHDKIICKISGEKNRYFL
jgi:hypothetical protein